MFCVCILLLGLVLIAQVHSEPGDFVVQHHLTEDQFTSTNSDLSRNGFTITWLNGYDSPDHAAGYACIFEKITPKPRRFISHKATLNEFRATYDARGPNGYRPVVINGFTLNGIVYYEAIWEYSANPLPISVYDYTTQQYQDAYQRYSIDQKLLIKHLSAWVVGNEVRFAAIWEPPVAGGDVIRSSAHHAVDAKSYSSREIGMVELGYQVALISGYTLRGVDYFAVIYEKTTSNHPRLNRFGMSSDDFSRHFDNNKYQGYVPRTISGYNPPGGHYAATWENRVMSFADIRTIDTIFEYVHKYSVPGLSVAITKDDRLVFARGFGYADKEARVIVTPHSAFRLMSISKSITATAVMKLAEKGALSLSDKVFGPEARIGDVFGGVYQEGVTSITVEHLLEHRSGWDGDASDPINHLSTMTADQVIANTVATLALHAEPNTWTNYSNFGYLVLGKVIEHAAQMSYESYVLTEILGPVGAHLYLANDETGLAQEVTYYPLGATSSFRIREFGPFGGWVGSAIELLRWSVHVDGLPGKPDFLEARTEEIMWKDHGDNEGLAKGFIISDGWRGHNGAFAGTNTFFVQRTDGSGFGFAVLINQRSEHNHWDNSPEAPTDIFGFELRDVVDGVIKRVKTWPSYDLF